MKKQSRLAQIVRRFRGHRIGVLGDFMLDELLRGEATRISPEAPVPVVLVKNTDASERFFPGGAGNVAANIAALGGRPVAFGTLGTDESGKKLRALLKRRGVAHEVLIEERNRVTPRKVRIVAHQHQLLRLDFEQPATISSRAAAHLTRELVRRMAELDALIISDYQKGCVTTELCHQVATEARQRRVPVFVDPKPEHPEICRDATVVTPNLREAEWMAGRPMRTRSDLIAGGQRLLAELGCLNLLITRGPEGMMLFESDGTTFEIPGAARPVYDVTGAGDTVVAVLALGYSSGATLREAAQLANLAAGRVVLKFGTAEVTPRELFDAIAGDSKDVQKI